MNDWYDYKHERGKELINKIIEIDKRIELLKEDRDMLKYELNKLENE